MCRTLICTKKKNYSVNESNVKGHIFSVISFSLCFYVFRRRASCEKESRLQLYHLVFNVFVICMFLCLWNVLKASLYLL